MNIGLFLDTYDPQVNGVVTSTKLLKEELEYYGHNVTIVTVKTLLSNIDNNNNNIIRIPSVPFPPLPEHRIGMVYSYNIIKLIENLNLDIIHTHTEFSIGLLGKFIAKRLNIPIVHTYHTMYEDYMHYITNNSLIKYASDLAKHASKLYCQSYDKIITPTEKAKKALINYGVDNEIDVIPTGIKIEKFKKENYTNEEIDLLKDHLSIDLDSPVILYIGRLAQEKSIDVIIRELPKVLENFPKTKFLIVGNGPERKRLEKLTQKLKVRSSVIFTGEKPWEEIGKYYQLGDVFVSASTTETQGLTFIEAMASKTPVLAKYDTNLDNFIKDKTNGRVFYKNYELSNILLEIFNQENKTKKMREQAYQDVQEISAKKFGYKIDRLYTELVYEENKKLKDKLKWVI